jgi:hypothetical protein
LHLQALVRHLTPSLVERPGEQAAEYAVDRSVDRSGMGLSAGAACRTAA